MNERLYTLFLGAVLLTVVALSALWELGLEDRLMPLVVSGYRTDTPAQHWEYVISVLIFGALSLALPMVIGRRLIHDHRRLTEEIKRLSEEDYLTGLYNRRKMAALLNGEIERCRRYDCRFSVILLDVDFFKDTNDRFGHHVGDRVLVALAQLIRQGIRKTDVAARWGGEEFLVLCPETPAEGATRVAEKLRVEIGAYRFDLIGSKTASFGVAETLPEDAAESLLRRADQALYAAKGAGRNRVKTARAA